ncbi:MAG: hypothetical protein U0X87_10615 [Anaerolineales bacterium]
MDGGVYNEKICLFRVNTFHLDVKLCANSESDEIGATATNSEFQSVTSTVTILPIATKRPSATPEIPTASITPMSVAPVSVSPLALNEFNAGTEMKRLNIIGTGRRMTLSFHPDGKRFAVATGRGIYLYDGTTFEQNGFIDVNDSLQQSLSAQMEMFWL